MRSVLTSYIFAVVAVLLVSNLSAAAYTFSESERISPDDLEMSDGSMNTAQEVELSDISRTDVDRGDLSRDMDILKRRYEELREIAKRESRITDGERRSEENISDQEEDELTIPDDVREREPIRIDSNDDLAEQAEYNNWSGDGSEEEPYTIEDYEIDGDETGYGIYIRNVTDHLVVKDCHIYNAKGEDSSETAGIHIQDTTNGHLENNTIFDNHQGIYLISSPGNTLLDNHARDNVDAGINLTDSHDNILKDNIVEGNMIGIQIWRSNDNEIVENVLRDNEARGISLDTELLSFSGSSDNRVINNDIVGVPSGLEFDFDYGIYIGSFSDQNIIEYNEISQCFFGIYVGLPIEMVLDEIDLPDPTSTELFPISPQDNRITDNSLHNSQTILNLNPYSIALFFTENNLLDNNTMKDGGVMILGGIESHWDTHTITENNTVNERPVRYWKNREGGRIPEGSGQILLASCDDVIIEEQDLTEASVGIQLGFSDDNLIRNNTVAGGVQGMDLQSSSSNLIYRNEFKDNLLGLLLLLSDTNEIYHNNFLGNMLENAVDIGTNQWNNGYPSGGNHWSDHEADDDHHGPEQDIPGSDGIFDESYEGEGFTDEYPLAEPVPTPHVRIEHPLDGSVLSEEDVTARWTGIYRFTDHLEYEIRLDDAEWIDMGEDKDHEFTGIEEGHHDLYVRVADEDGNTFTNLASFIIDLTPPDINIEAPEDEEILVTEDVTVEWKGTDEVSGIDLYELRLDGELKYEGDEELYDLTGLEDGNYSIEIRAVDRAGNEAIDTTTFYVDTTPPDLTILSPEDGEKFGEESVMVEWEASDEIAGIHYFEVRMDEKSWINVGEAFSYNFTDLEDGEYTVEVRVHDEVGNNAREETYFVVTTVPPLVNISEPAERESIDEGSVTIAWEGDGVRTEIEYYEVRLNGGEWIDVGMNTSHIFDDLDHGEHTVEVRGWDEVGNSRTESVDFLIDLSEEYTIIVGPVRDVKGEFIDDLTVTLCWDDEEISLHEGEHGRYNFTVELVSPPEEVEFEYIIEHEELEREQRGSFFGDSSGELIIDLLGKERPSLGFVIAVGAGTAIILGMLIVKKRDRFAAKTKKKDLIKLEKRDG